MALRSRIKRALTFGSQDDGTKSTSKIWKRHSKAKDPRLNDPNVYQPGEKMPTPKYRREPCPKHKARLEAYSWATAWRRHSYQSQYSPMGSRMPSRMNSKTTLRASLDRQSMECPMSPMSPKDNASTPAVDSAFGGSFCVIESQVKEESVNVVVSPTVPIDTRQSSSIDHGQFSVVRHSISLTSDAVTLAASDPSLRPSSSGSTQPPWTQKDLELALRRSHLSENTGNIENDTRS